MASTILLGILGVFALAISPIVLMGIIFMCAAWDNTRSIKRAGKKVMRGE